MKKIPRNKLFIPNNIKNPFAREWEFKSQRLNYNPPHFHSVTIKKSNSIGYDPIELLEYSDKPKKNMSFEQSVLRFLFNICSNKFYMKSISPTEITCAFEDPNEAMICKLKF